MYFTRSSPQEPAARRGGRNYSEPYSAGRRTVLGLSGNHSVGGGRYLRRLGLDEQIVRLVAHHSFALLEAAERGPDGELAAEFPPGDPMLSDALCFADMTTSPDGEPVDPDDRLAEIQERYGPGDVVTRFIDRARPDILAAVTRTREHLAVVDAQPI